MKILTGERMHLREASFNDWSKTRKHRFSRESLKYDDPDRPMPSIEEEKKWWVEDVQSGKHLIFTICLKNNGIVGFIHAFSFNKEKSDCETGIGIFPQENYGKGYAYEAYRIFLPYLKKEYKLKSTYILVHPRNKRAIRLYEKLNYKRREMVKDANMMWLRMEYDFIDAKGV